MQLRRSGLVFVFVGALIGLVVPSASSAPLSSRPAGSVSFNGAVTAMVTQGSTVYVVGAFTRATDAGGEQVRSHVAAVDTATGRLLPWHSRINGTPLAVSRYRNQLFVGGDFTKAGGVAVSGLARISTATGRVARSFRPRVNATVRALVSTKHAVYVGGTSTASTAQPATTSRRWHGARGHAWPGVRALTEQCRPCASTAAPSTPVVPLRPSTARVMPTSWPCDRVERAGSAGPSVPTSSTRSRR